MTANSNQETSAVHPEGSTTYSVQEIAVILGISKKLAYKLCEENCFISKRIGRIIRINKRSFEDWLNSGAN
ncbi:helix-turn-helix domain-containing protein [Sporofaciens sp. JLR.KK001]|jgi:excisionase family DNA binding protein|uniref:helix-turn-helix domain-containing protein n=1 Tax=Sporofaciens sp. JLR.KK001 TaxID=3112621 RepID=UPI002FF0A7D4